MKSGAIAVALLALSTVAAPAATLDFSGVQGSNPSVLALSNATLTNTDGGAILAGSSCSGEADGFCFLVPNQFNAAASGTIDFSSTIKDLTFDADGWNPGDFVAISAYLGASLLGTITVTANGLLDFSSFGLLNSLEFADSSQAAGVGWSTFSFTEVAAVPLPATLPLLALGLLGVGAVARRRNAA